MAVIYLIFNEGYSATAGEDWMRPALAEEAMRLARMLVAFAPDDVEVLALQALLEPRDPGWPLGWTRPASRCCSRRRTGRGGIRCSCGVGWRCWGGPRSLASRGEPVGKYFLQASIAAEHARAGRAEDTNWRRIAALYDVLASAAPGAVVEVNRAVAHGRAFGPDAGLAVLAEVDESALGDSPLVASVRGDLLERAGSHAEAAEAFAHASAVTNNESERSVLTRRAEENLASAATT